MGVEIGPSAPLPTQQPLTGTGQPLNVAGRMHAHEEREWQTRKTRIEFSGTVVVLGPDPFWQPIT